MILGMLKKAFQVRLDPRLHEQLDFFSTMTGASMNRLVADALELYLQNLAVELDADLSDTLRRVRAYADSESNVARDVDAFVEAELALEDPAEGSIEGPRQTSAVSRRLGSILAGLG